MCVDRTVGGGFDLLSSTAGQGSGLVNYSILPNPNGTLRRGGVAVEDQRVEIAQEPAPCRYEVSPSSVELGESGGDVELNVRGTGRMHLDGAER